MSISRLFNDSFFRSPSIFSNEFQTVFSDLDRIASAFPYAGKLDTVNPFSPRVKLTEENNEFKIEAEVAGFPKESLSIDFPDSNVLRLSGQYEEQRNNDDKHDPAPVSSKDEGKSAKGKADSTAVTTTASSEAQQIAQAGKRIWHNEHIAKSFTRTIGLPAHVDTDSVKASLDNGILSIVLPKLDKNKVVKKVEIL